MKAVNHAGEEISPGEETGDLPRRIGFLGAGAEVDISAVDGLIADRVKKVQGGTRSFLLPSSLKEPSLSSEFLISDDPVGLNLDPVGLNLIVGTNVGD